MLSNASAVRCALAIGWLCLAGLTAGCQDGDSPAGALGAAGRGDAFEASLADAESEERPYLQAARPALAAVAARDWDAFYDQLSTQAKGRMDALQFVPPPRPGEKHVTTRIVRTPTKGQFMELIGTMEAALGRPGELVHAYVEKTGIDFVPQGRGDIRMATIRAQFYCQPSDVPAERSAAEPIIGEDGAGSGKRTKNESLDEAARPCLNVKLLLFDEGNSLKIRYFEFTRP